MKRLLLTLATLAATQASAAEFVIKNNNRPGKGFNDPTPVAPAGLNFATTRGGQAQIAFRAAGAIWGATLRSVPPIIIDAAFMSAGEDATFACSDPNRVVLGFARKLGQIGGDPSFPNQKAQYPFALANALAGRVLTGSQAAILTRFNAELGTARCPGFSAWDFSLDEDGTTLLSTILHEFGHGLGFASGITTETGIFSDGVAAFDYQAFDVTGTTPQTWVSSGSASRQTLAITPGALVLSGENTKRDIPRFLGFSPSLQLSLGNVDAGLIDYVPGAFSGTLEGGGVIVASTPADGCAELTQGPMTGKVALIRRGTCTFAEKANRAADAGAIGLLVANNVDGLIQMAPAKPQRHFPAVMVTQAVGDLIDLQLSKGPASVSWVPGSTRSNANPTGAYLYTPTAIEPGSSISHFNTGSYPRALLMQPASEPSTPLNLDLTASAMADMGWSVINGLTVSVVKALDGPIIGGSENRYLVVVINRRATDIGAVTLEVTGPGTVLSYEGACQTVPCSLGEMRSGATELVMVNVKTAAGATGDFAVTAKLTPSSASAEDSLTYTASQEVASGGDVKASIVAPKSLDEGTDAVFVTTVVNQGPSIAAPVTVSISGVAADGSALALTGDCAEPSPCGYSELAKDAPLTLNTTFSVPKGFNKKVTVTATVTSGTPDSDASNNTASTTAVHAGCSTISASTVSLWLAAFVLVAMMRRRSAR